MQVSLSAEIAALVITLVVHVVGAGVLVWNMLDGSDVRWRDLWPRDEDDDGGGGPPGDEPQGPSGGGEPVVMRPPVLDGTYATRDPRTAPEPQRARR
jgi:hypothetical protein